MKQDLVTHLSARFKRGETPRVAIIPFDVPVNFSAIMNPRLRLGHKLASDFQKAFLEQGENLIVEVVDRAEWPGKRLDFDTGNYIALEQARRAGFDYILVGYMDEIKNDYILTVHTKVIDTENDQTIWYGTTDVSSSSRPTRGLLNVFSKGFYPDRDDLFEFPERLKLLPFCTSERIFHLEEEKESSFFN